MKILNAIHRYDIFLFYWLLNVSIHKSLTRICRYISKTGDGELYVMFMLMLAWQQGFGYRPLQVMLLAFAIERPIYFVLKHAFKRNRPEQALPQFHSLITPSDQFSFPSGHTSAAFVMATLMSQEYPTLIVPLYLWAGTVGFSRVVLGVHFPTDTLVGSVMGIIIAYFCLGQLV